MRINSAALLSGVADIVAGTLATAKCHLWATYDGSPQPTPGNFVESTFSGYAVYTPIVWQGDRIFPDSQVGQSFTHKFVGANADPQVSETVGGYMILSSDGTTVLLYEAFASPIPMVNVDSILNLTVSLKLPPTLNVGGNTVS